MKPFPLSSENIKVGKDWQPSFEAIDNYLTMCFSYNAIEVTI